MKTRAEVERLVNGLAEATDEATGHPLDNLVNAWTEKWLADVEAEYATYVARVEKRLGLANAELSELDLSHEQDRLRLKETSTARSAAVRWLGGKSEDVEFGQPGFTDPTLLAGRPRSTFVHVLALVLAAGADIAAFIQVMELLMPDQNTMIVALLVVGLTAVVLYLAHSAGVQLRERKAGLKWATRTSAAICLSVWAAVGGLATWARLIAPPRPPATVVLTPLNATPPAGLPTFTVAGAAVFLALYVGSGVTACLGAYWTYNRVRGSYRTAVKAYVKAADDAGRTAKTHGVVTTAWQHQRCARDAAAKVLDREIARRRAFGEEMKQYTRVLIATHGCDPAITDAVLDKDRRPYAYEPPYTNGSHERKS